MDEAAPQLDSFPESQTLRASENRKSIRALSGLDIFMGSRF